jgi:hypothetical protein
VCACKYVFDYSMCTCVYVCMYIFMYVCTHVCMYVCNYMCTHACLNARCMAMKFPEFYCSHTCVFTAYWEGSPSKYSPWTTMHLAQRCFHCWKCFWNSCRGIAFSAVITFFWMSSLSWNLRPFKADFISGNSQKSFVAKSGKRVGVSFQ